MCKSVGRIQLIAKFKNITIGALERTIGASKGVLSRAINNSTDIQTKWLELIVENYPEISPTWLLTGEGEMLRGAKTERSTKDIEQIKELTAKVNELKKAADQQPNIVRVENTATAKLPANSKLLPLVSQSAIAGFGGADFSIAEQDVKEYYVVPKFKYCTVDFMIEIYGASMYPKYNSGDIVACTVIKDSNFIQWNRCHIVGTMHQGILCKRLKPSDNKDCITAVSDNPSYPPFDIPTSEITGIALICGVIRCE